MATWTLTGQRTDGTSTVVIEPTHRLWFNAGVNLTDNIAVGSYQDGTHGSDGADAHLAGCGGTAGHINNVKFLSSTTTSINGAASATLSSTVPSAAQAPFRFNFSDPASISTSNGKFYFYDGTTDSTAMAGVTVQAIEVGISTSWVAANGSGAALALANHAAATSHDFRIATSLSPSSNGAKAGKCKITLTYV